MVPIRYNLRSLMLRRTTSMMTALGVALVVMLLLVLMGFVAGMRQSRSRATDRGNWMVVTRGINEELASAITVPQYSVISGRPEVAVDPDGKPLASPEKISGFDPTPEKPLSQLEVSAQARGVNPIAYKVHRHIRIIEGRWPVPGAYEFALGRKLVAFFPKLRPPATIQFNRQNWRIVGTFSDNSSEREGEAWTDLGVLLQQQKEGLKTYNSIHLVLRPGSEQSFKEALTHDGRLRVDVLSEAEFYGGGGTFAAALEAVGMVIFVILGIGASFGGMNTMYAAVAHRSREIGVLRSLGFARMSVLSSFLVESLLLAVAGGVAGEVLGVIFATLTGLNSRFMRIGSSIFSFYLSPAAFIGGLVAAAAIGILGGLAPAWRAAGLEIYESIREP